jgi:protein YibB
MQNDITIVTAFFDIGRGNLPTTKHGRVLPHYQHRSVDTYFDFFSKLAKIQNDMVIYTTPNFKDRILEIRSQYGLQDKTKVVTLESYLPDDFVESKNKIREIMDSPEYYGKVLNPQLIEYWHDDYVLVNIFKSVYVTDAIDKGLVTNDLVAWIDFGYVRDDNTIPPSNKWTYDFDREKIHFFCQRQIDANRPINDIIYTGDVYIQGCHIVAGREKWNTLKELVIYTLNLLIENKLIDDDQTLLLMALLIDSENFELHQADPNDWFLIFRKYNEQI